MNGETLLSIGLLVHETFFSFLPFNHEVMTVSSSVV